MSFNRSAVMLAAALACTATLVAQSGDAKWDVSAPFGPTRALTFDTTEGTWMNVDVSPDGKTIVFDLLGDIYTMPIAGSGGAPATRIAGGVPFEMQPRFSPDGSRIAFTSDRGGLWNIWTMKPDGSDARQVSHERQWFVNSPSWSADGQAIFARKHYVASRSLGAGEIWMYHAAGSDGLQLTKKENFQKDTGEPAASPDGKYVYYSKDVTPGSTFEYNKDPNGVIFAVLRHDLTRGTESVVIAEPGGSVAPRPSPDGKWLAYVHRVRTRSYLYLRNLESGESFPVFDKLDKDLQEAWTVQGVYSQYAWTPDSSHIVIWGQGKIWNVDVAAKTGVDVPFTVHVDTTMTEPVRFAQDVAPDTFNVKMLRHARVSPSGNAVTFSALGHVYVRPLPTGEPQRISAPAADPRTEPIEQAPSWSHDGTRITYATWSDTAFGKIMVYDTATKQSRVVVAAPGHYTEPAFSPDGRWIVYRKSGGEGWRTNLYTSDPGLYVVAADGSGTPRKVTDSGQDPEFSADGTRILFRDQRAAFSLVSVDLSGNDERVLAQSPNAQEFAVSPDNKWIAFEERWRTYVAPLVMSGAPLDLSAGVSTIPSAQVSRDTGFFLHWSGDSQTLHWMLGPTLYSRRVDRTFTFVSGGAASPAAPETSGVNIGFSVKADTPSGTMALVGARVITMASAASPSSVIENATIVVTGNRITAVGPTSQVRIPADARRIDVRGKTIMPGIIDVHAHFGSEGDGIQTHNAWPLQANLAFGVTTMHDPSNDTEMVFSDAEMARAGATLAPRMFSTGTILYGAETPFKAQINSYEDALMHLRRIKAAGGFSVKSYNQQRRDSRQMILKAARELEMDVVPEGGSLVYMNTTQILDGHTSVEHSLPVPVLYKDIVTAFARSGVAYTPLDDIRASESIAMVMANGRLYDKDLNEVGGAKRPPLWFVGK